MQDVKMRYPINVGLKIICRKVVELTRKPWLLIWYIEGESLHHNSNVLLYINQSKFVVK
mgnify:CR=1 FL=1